MYVQHWFNLTCRPRALDQPGVVLSHTNKETKADEGVEADHEYEILDQYNQKYEEVELHKIPVPVVPPKKSEEQTNPESSGDYDITQCPAYETVHRENERAEASIMQPSTVRSDLDGQLGGGVYDTVDTTDI